MDTEQYEEAVRDYEKVYQTEKTKGEDTSPELRRCDVLLSWFFFLTKSGAFFAI